MTARLGRASARELVADALARHLRPPPALSVPEWSERHRWLEKRTTAAAGWWRNEKTPYLVEPMLCMTDPAVRNVVLMKAAQTGGSEVAINWFGRQIECDPGPLLWVTSTEQQVQKISRRRFDPMLDRAPLRPLVSRRKGRDSDRTTAQSTFANGSLGIVTANSPASLSSDPACHVVCDETDRYSDSSGSEGDPLDMILARQQTFENYGARTVFVSTPSIDGVSRIQQLYESSDQRRYQVPCPECGTLQELIWYGKREDGHEFGVRWDRAVPKHQAPATAYYQCEHCPARWSDAQRWAAVAPESGARWVATKPFVKTAGFYISGLMSTFVRLSDCVERWLAAIGKPSKLQTFWNLVMGLPFSLVAERAPASIPLEAWDGFDLPSSACILLGFADVQADRLEVTIAGMAPDESVLVAEHQIFQGATDLPQVWADVEAFMMRRWVRSDGMLIGLTAFGVDCSYSFERVCDWAAQVSHRLGLRVFPLRGVARGIDEPIVKDRIAGKAHSGRWFYNSNSDAAKLCLIQKLQLRSGPGRVRFPARECFSDVYFEQLRTETLRRRYVRGYPVLEWHLRSGARNEALDCLAGVLALKEWLNPALDVLAHRNPMVTAPAAAAAVAPIATAGAPAAPAAEAVVARAIALRAAAPEIPHAPAPEPPRVASRHGGAWFDSARGGRRY